MQDSERHNYGKIVESVTGDRVVEGTGGTPGKHLGPGLGILKLCLEPSSINHPGCT